MQKIPPIPGCAATCWALYRATVSIRSGDHQTTNRMFRARIYAQAFTLLAVTAGGMYYKEERSKRGEYMKALEEKNAQEKRDAWIRELEARDKEDREWRERHKKIEKVATPASSMASAVSSKVKGAVDEAGASPASGGNDTLAEKFVEETKTVVQEADSSTMSGDNKKSGVLDSVKEIWGK